MQGGDLINEAMLFYWVKANFQAKELFFLPQTSLSGRFYFTKGATF